MSENLRKELGVDEWLELVKEDKDLNSAYISFAQYMYILEKENQQLKEQLKQRDGVIKELEKWLNQEWKQPLAKIYVSDVIKELNKLKGDNNE